MGEKLRKGVLLLMCLMSLCGAAAGCGDRGENNPGTNFPSYTVKTDVKTDGQYYTPEGIVFPASLWQTPASERYEALDRGEIRAYFISSVDDTQVFCYVGLPAEATAEKPVPAVVLVHGATGTAFYDWVRAWNDRGYAAIAMDTEGRMPTASASTYNSVFETSIKPHGPVNQAFTDCKNPVEQQWVYHALCSVIASASFLASFEEVDASRMGITGVSYGGFLTCLAVGFDDRYTFAAPVYGCLSNAEGDAEFGSYINGNEGAQIWDGTGTLEASRTPILFVNSDTDNHFSPDSITRCVNASRYAAVSFIPGLTHGHAQGAEVKEVFAFADQLCRNGTPLIRVLEKDVGNQGVRIAVPEGVTIAEYVQRYTLSETLNGSTVWSQEQAELDGDWIYYSAAGNKKFHYVSIKDSRGYYVSSAVI